MERHINAIRFLALMALFSIELLLSIANLGFDFQMVFVDGMTMLATALWCLLLHKQSSKDSYKPWLKYVSIFADYMIILLITLELNYLEITGHFLRTLHTAQFDLMLISILMLFNVLSAFRQGKLVIYYSTILCLVSATAILEFGHVAKEIEVHQLLVLLFSGLLAWSLSHYMTETYTRLRHRERLLRYLPEKLVHAVEKGIVDITPGGQKRAVTILMADIRGFTGLCEQLDPQIITAMLNQYCSTMSSVIFKHNGVIDKFIGDAIMAVFGAPIEQNNNALNAIDAAREMLKKLPELNQQFAKAGYPEIKIGIGIHSGNVVAGNIGSITRMDYTVIGDTVNVAARIESMTKELGSNLLMSEDAVLQAKIEDLTRIGEVQIRGRQNKIVLFSQ